MTDLLFIRHGPTAWNEAGRIQGRRDVPLTAHAFAALSARRLPAGFRDGCRWVSSPLRRARATARALGAEAFEVEPRLIEMDWGEWEGWSLPDLRARIGDPMRRNEERGLDFETPAGDSPRRVQERLRPWLAELGRAGQPVAAVSHKGVGRALLALAIGWDMKDRSPVRLEWERAHRFRVSGSGEPRLAEPNIALEGVRPVSSRGDGARRVPVARTR